MPLRQTTEWRRQHVNQQCPATWRMDTTTYYCVKKRGHGDQHVDHYGTWSGIHVPEHIARMHVL